jgi:hypothetical protein
VRYAANFLGVDVLPLDGVVESLEVTFLEGVDLAFLGVDEEGGGLEASRLRGIEGEVARAVELGAEREVAIAQDRVDRVDMF